MNARLAALHELAELGKPTRIDEELTARLLAGLPSEEDEEERLLREAREEEDREVAAKIRLQSQGREKRPPERPAILSAAVDAAGFLAAPMADPEWLIEGLLTRGGSGGLSGPPGAGKSNLIACWLPELVKAEGSIMGRWHSPKALRVLLVDAELSDAALHQRLHRAFKDNPPPVGMLHLLTVDGAMRTWARPLNFMEEALAAELAEAIIARSRIEQIDLVIFDSLSGLWPGLPENSPPDIIKNVYPLRHRLRYAGCSAVYIHHDAKGGASFRGSTAITQPLDFALSIKPLDSKTAPAFTLKIEKQRHGFSRQRCLECELNFSGDGLGVTITGDGSAGPADILQAIDCAGPKISVRKLAESLGIARSTLDDKLRWLRGKGYLSADGYEIADAGRRYAGLA